MTAPVPGMPEESARPPWTRGLSGASTTILFARARAGDTLARDLLVSRLQPRLLRWAAGRIPTRLRSTMDTQDLVQEAFRRSLDRLPTLVPLREDAALAYLRTVILNLLRNAARDASRHPHDRVVSPATVDPSASPLEQLVGAERIERYERAVLLLDAADQALLFLRFELGCSHKEIAEHLGKPSADAARMGVTRAVTRLLRELNRE